MVKGASQGDDIGKLFVGGLSHETDEESLKSYFSRFGLVSDVVVMRDPNSKKPRGFGFVKFQDPNSVNDVLSHDGPHICDHKTIDPKQAVPRGPSQAGAIAQQPAIGKDNNAQKIFVGGIANGTTEDDLRNYFSAYGKVTHVHLMYDNSQTDGPKRMRGFGFVTFESSQPVEKTANIHFHQINGKTVEVKRAERREPKGGLGGMPGMNAFGAHPGAHAGYATGQYAQQAYSSMQHPVGMGRGYSGIPTSAAGYAGYPGAAPGYGYAGAAAGVPPAHYAGDPNAAAVAAMYSRGTAPGYGAGYAPGMTGAQQVPVSTAAAPGGYPDYSRMQATQAAQPGAAPGAPPVDNTGAPDYSAYGLGNYQQQDLQYGPARGSSFPSENSYGSYGSADPAGYPGAATGYGGETPSFGRGSSASRGFHPYGR